MATNLNVEWFDLMRAPKCAPNLAFPDGIDIDVSMGAEAKCSTALPYPAERCGLYVVNCALCGIRVAVTTAGRSDDPRSLTVACKTEGAACWERPLASTAAT